MIGRDTGEVEPAYVFVAVMCASSYTYVEASMHRDLPSWIGAHMSCPAGSSWCSTAISSSISVRAIHFISKAAATIPGVTATTAKLCFSGSTRRRHSEAPAEEAVSHFAALRYRASA